MLPPWPMILFHFLTVLLNLSCTKRRKNKGRRMEREEGGSVTRAGRKEEGYRKGHLKKARRKKEGQPLLLLYTRHTRRKDPGA